jgi:hypothetical protein
MIKNHLFTFCFHFGKATEACRGTFGNSYPRASVTVRIEEPKIYLPSRTALDIQIDAKQKINRGASTEREAYLPVQNSGSKRPGRRSTAVKQVP